MFLRGNILSDLRLGLVEWASCPIGQEHLGQSRSIVISLMFPTCQLEGMHSLTPVPNGQAHSLVHHKLAEKVCLKANKHETKRRKNRDTNTRQTQTSMPEPGFELRTLRTTVERLPAAPRQSAVSDRSASIANAKFWDSLNEEQFLFIQEHISYV